MTTEQQITDLAARLKAAYPKRVSSVNLIIHNYSSGLTEIAYYGYLSPKTKLARAEISPEFTNFPELLAWVEKKWL